MVRVFQKCFEHHVHVALAFIAQVVAPWRSLQALTPDATQLADPTWQPTPFHPTPQAGVQAGAAPNWQQAADWAKQGRINNLSLMALDVLMAPHDAKDRCCCDELLYHSQYNYTTLEMKPSLPGGYPSSL